MAVMAAAATTAVARISSYCIEAQSAYLSTLAINAAVESFRTVVAGIQDREDDANGAAKL